MRGGRSILQQQSARFRHWPNKSIHMKVSVRDKASTPQTAFCPGWSNKSARWEYRLTCLQLQAGPGSSRGLKRCQKNGCGSGSGKHQQRDGAGFMLTNGVTRHKGWVREGKEPPDSGHPKQPERALCPLLAWMHSMPGVQLGQDHLWYLFQTQALQTHRYLLCGYRYFTASCKCKQLSWQHSTLLYSLTAAFNNQAETGVQSSHNHCFSLQNPRVAKQEICQKLNSFISICTNPCLCRSCPLAASCPAEQWKAGK